MPTTGPDDTTSLDDETVPDDAQASSGPVDLDVVVLPAFAADDFTADGDLPHEVEPWLDDYDFEHERTVPGANAPLLTTDDGVAITPTGMGKADAAVTVAALLSSPDLDCSDAYFVTVGIAGASPEVGTLGSVFLADHVVDWDRKQTWDSDGESEEGESDERDESATPRSMQLLPYRPRDYAYALDDDLVATAHEWAGEVDLRNDERADRYRERYAHAAARAEPTVAVGTTVCGDEYWHGATYAEQARWLVEQYDAGEYATTEMEDYGTATALDRFDRLDRYLSVRGVVNFDRPPGGQPAHQSVAEGLDEVAVELGLENAYRVGSRVVDRLRDDATRGSLER